MLDERALHKITERGVSEIIVKEEFLRLLEEGKPLRLKMGFDPSRPDIHLGHVVGLRKLRELQELGHQVILIVGDWTAQIGDPSGQSATRPMLSHQEVVANAESYMQQFFKVVDRQRTQAVWQSEWFGKFGLADVLQLTSRFTVAQFLDRDDFARRFEAHKPIAITELLYPLLQAYDSVAIDADVEFGGTDQRFNLLVGRELQVMMGRRLQQCFLMPILVGTDGVQKMSQSLGNYIAVEDPPNDMYGKVMSLPDELIMQYFEYLTDLPDEELEEMAVALRSQSVNPMELKKRLAGEITSQFHAPEETRRAQEWFERVVQRREAPEDVQQYSISRLENQPTGAASAQQSSSTIMATSSAGASSPSVTVASIVDVLVNTYSAKSRSEAKRLIAQGAVEIDGEKIDSENVEPRVGNIIKIGRRRYLEIVD